MDRAFVDPSAGDTTCVWNAPTLDDVKAMFAAAGVKVDSITLVEEMPAETS